MFLRNTNQSERLLPTVERLESRRLLAGNVFATITGAGNLVINGDAADNRIEVNFGLAGEVAVVGHAGTTVNDDGLAGATLSGDVIINLKGGDDLAVLNGLDYSNISGIEKVTVNGGAGNDELRMNDLEFWRDNSSLKGGAGNDRIYINDGRGFGKLTVSGGTGNDIIQIESTELQDSNVTGARGELSVLGGGGGDIVVVSRLEAEKLGVNLGGGDDLLDLFMSDVTGDTSIVAGGGNDELYIYGTATGSANINSGAGEDVILFDSLAVKYGQDIAISTGGSDDLVRFNDSFILGELKVVTSGGSDDVRLDNVTADSTNINTGGGNDLLDVRSSDVGSVSFLLGGGADELVVSALSGSGTANGGAGFDEYRILTGYGSPFTYLNFEEVDFPPNPMD